ncbi:DUF3995 domain-containing protein [Hymenobacter glaciei]|uniref:DUF3995 domain-containing protein n=1 Tax=Hymenobacter glaciei TaxID=877209 RepID=A0ABP7UUZ5_9BACT
MHWLAAFNTFIFLTLGGLHVYWALGGRQGIASALPATPDGTLQLRPSAALTAAVAAGLLAMSALSAVPLVLGAATAPGWLRLGNGGLGLVFGLRALGDFRYVGLSKRVHDTTFARLDTRYYTPLCLALAASCATLALAA